MTSRAEHFRQAEDLLVSLKDFGGSPSHTEFESRAQLIAAAQVHATLAACPVEVIHDVLDAEAEKMLQNQEQKWAQGQSE